MILVIGYAHLDIVATVTSENTLDNVDEVGTMSIRIGGTGYNVASNLAQSGEETALLTAWLC